MELNVVKTKEKFMEAPVQIPGLFVDDRLRSEGRIKRANTSVVQGSSAPSTVRLLVSLHHNPEKPQLPLSVL